MSNIVAVYKVPELQLMLFISSALDRFEQRHSHLQGLQTEKECSEHTERYEDHKLPTVPELWTGSAISAQDFLEIIENIEGVEIKLPNQACNDLEKLSLLSIRAIAPRCQCSDQYHSVKYLTYVPQEDVIEVFI